MEEYYRRVDPNHDQWQTEVLGEKAAAQLEILGRLLTDAEGRAARNLGDVVSPQLAGHPLRPAELDIVYDDGSLSVIRGSNKRSDQPILDVAGFARSLQHIAEMLTAVGDARAALKVVHVDVPDGSILTSAHVQAVANGRSSDLQINATWKCRWSALQSGQLRLDRLVVEDYEEIRRVGKGGIRFSDCTEAALAGNETFDAQLRRGIDFWRGRLPVGFGIGVGSWQGVAIGDVNGDGLDDVYVPQPGGLPNALFMHQSNGSVVDRASAAGLDWLDPCRSALLVDLDNDGDQDLVLAMGLGLIILENEQGRFEFDGRNALVTPADPASICSADYDGDGDLDLFLCGYNSRENISSDTHIGFPLPFHDANNGGPNLLLRNEGEMRFRDVTRQTGLEENNRRFSLAAAWEDFDNDGDQDLYVANDFGRNNLYRNDGGKFTDVAAKLGVEDSAAGMSVVWGDYDNDGWMDLYVSNMFSSAGNRVAYQRRFQGDASAATRATFQRHARGNSLFRNVRGESFEDVSVAAAVTMGRWAWGAQMADLNNDGRNDFLVANGFVTGEDTNDL